uniref:Zinc finger protein 276 n=1 Tax=Canis lupus familiaris TaxID=9615 RepID=A0A8C0TIY7_CANLF
MFSWELRARALPLAQMWFVLKRCMWGSSLEGLLHLGSWEDSRAWASPPLGRCSLPRSLCFPCPVQRAASPADLMSLCLPRNRPGSCHGALSPLPWEVLLTESPQHFWQGTWGQFRQTTSRGASFHQGLPASAGGGRPPGPSSVSVRLQELPCPVLPVPWPPQVLPAESQRLPDGPPEDLHKGWCPAPTRGRGGSVSGVSGKKSESKEAKKSEEPKIRKKPGPKPGWKNKLRCEREELPTIYKCPYQGCTAVYRGADGMKKHIKEHHEEVRERPCPHPGCNKVFMIDRYLQRHVKLIHTEVRNYICDECGQTFKQRKHLLVHQMRHSGAKPLQCEVCGFQCRQRASLKYHMTKHKAETELDFACDQCGRRFEKAHNLNVHMSMVHPLTQTQDKALTLEPAPGPVEGQAVKPEPT